MLLSAGTSSSCGPPTTIQRTSSSESSPCPASDSSSATDMSTSTATGSTSPTCPRPGSSSTTGPRRAAPTVRRYLPINISSWATTATSRRTHATSDRSGATASTAARGSASGPSTILVTSTRRCPSSRAARYPSAEQALGPHRGPERKVFGEGTDNSHLDWCAQNVIGDSAHVFRGDGVDQRHLFFNRLDRSEQQLLVCEPERHPVGALELQAQSALGEFLRPHKLLLGQIVIAQVLQLGDDRINRADRLLQNLCDHDL